MPPKVPPAGIEPASSALEAGALTIALRWSMLNMGQNVHIAFWAFGEDGRGVHVFGKASMRGTGIASLAFVTILHCPQEKNPTNDMTVEPRLSRAT